MDLSLLKEYLFAYKRWLCKLGCVYVQICAPMAFGGGSSSGGVGVGEGSCAGRTL